MDIEKIKEQLRKDMTIDGVVHNRYYHSLGVANASCSLVIKHNLKLDLDTAYIAGLLHDATKLIDKKVQKEMLYKLGYNDDDEIMKSTNVWHGETAPTYIKSVYGIVVQQILDAVHYHVMGRPNMTDLEKVVFVADYIEENRKGEVFETARKIAYIDLDDAVRFILKSQIDYITSNNQYLISQTLKTYEYYKGDKR